MKFSRSILEAYLAVALFVLTITSFLLLSGIRTSDPTGTITNILLLIVAGVLILNTMLLLKTADTK